MLEFLYKIGYTAMLIASLVLFGYAVWYMINNN